MPSPTLLKPIKSPFRYPGGKSKSAPRRAILSLMPRDTKEYREPFVGGGGIFFGLRRKVEKVWLNDIHPGLIAVYQALRDRPEHFISRCAEIPIQSQEEVVPPPVYNRRLREVFERFKEGEDDEALRYYFLNRTVWAGRVTYDPARASRLYFSNPTGWNILKGETLSWAARRLRGTRLTCGDFERVFREPGKNVWVYADPPYYRDTQLVNTDKQYEYGFSSSEHKRLMEVMVECPHKVCLSYDNQPQLHVWAKRNGLRLRQASWTYCGTSSAEKRVGKEVLITNY